MPVPLNASVATIEIGGQSYPVVSERNCLVCRSPLREQIENQLIGGRLYQSIADDLPEDAGLTKRNIGDHYRNGHLPVYEASVQAVRQEQAAQRGEAIKPAIEAAVEHFRFAQNVVTRAQELVADGDLEPTIRDGLKAAEFIAKYDPVEVVGEDLYVQAFCLYFDAAKEYMTQEQFYEFGDQLLSNPLLTELMEESKRRQAEASTDR